MMAAALKRIAPLLALCAIALAARPAGVWLDVPFLKQEKNGCGAASIAMVMQYWERQQQKPIAADPADIQRVLYSRQGHGIYASDLEEYFRGHGYSTFAFSATWSDLQQHLEKGRPLIVALKPSRLGSSLHFVVVTGIDSGHDLVLLNDPAQRKLLSQERAEFEKEWRGTGQWMLLALPQPSSR
jgi:ABC-type bacteriocin/lantibiotic exporter with double-glycine peptidase domain